MIVPALLNGNYFSSRCLKCEKLRKEGFLGVLGAIKKSPLQIYYTGAHES